MVKAPLPVEQQCDVETRPSITRLHDAIDLASEQLQQIRIDDQEEAFIPQIEPLILMKQEFALFKSLAKYESPSSIPEEKVLQIEIDYLYYFINMDIEIPQCYIEESYPSVEVLRRTYELIANSWDQTLFFDEMDLISKTLYTFRTNLEGSNALTSTLNNQIHNQMILAKAEKYIKNSLLIPRLINFGNAFGFGGMPENVRTIFEVYNRNIEYHMDLQQRLENTLKEANSKG